MSTNRRSSAYHQQLENVTDLTTLPDVSDDIIVSCLRERFLTDNIYTALNSSALVVVNPHKYVPSNADSVLFKYATEYRNTSEEKTPLPPHIFQLANNAYYHMRRTTQDQCILLRFVFLFFNQPISSHPGISAENPVVASQRIGGWRSELCSSSVSVIPARRAPS